MGEIVRGDDLGVTMAQDFRVRRRNIHKNLGGDKCQGKETRFPGFFESWVRSSHLGLDQCFSRNSFSANSCQSSLSCKPLMDFKHSQAVRPCPSRIMSPHLLLLLSFSLV